MSETAIKTYEKNSVRPDRRTTSTYFERSVFEALDRLAQEKRVSRSLLIREAVARLLSEAGR